MNNKTRGSTLFMSTNSILNTGGGLNSLVTMMTMNSGLGAKGDIGAIALGLGGG